MVGGYALAIVITRLRYYNLSLMQLSPTASGAAIASGSACAVAAIAAITVIDCDCRHCLGFRCYRGLPS